MLLFGLFCSCSKQGLRCIGFSQKWLLLLGNMHENVTKRLCFYLTRDSQEFSPALQFESISLQRSAFFMIQLSHLYMTTAKTIALTRWIFGGKVMFLLFSMLFRFVIAFLPRSKCLLISWLQSPSAVTVSIHQPPIHLPVSNGTKCHDLVF